MSHNYVELILSEEVSNAQMQHPKEDREKSGY